MTREEKKEIALQILSVIVASGFVAVAVVAPGLAIVPSLFMAGRRVKRDHVRQATRFALERQWIRLDRYGRERRFIITNKGRRRFIKNSFGKDSIKTPARWDRIWRVVIFDIPEKRRELREVFRKTMKVMGFVPVQESVWVHPFSCEKVVNDLATLYFLRPYVKVLFVKHFEGESEFLHKFNLESNQFHAAARK